MKAEEMDNKIMEQAENILSDQMGQQLLKDVLKDEISQAMVKNN
jgi:hypothetical protein